MHLEMDDAVHENTSRLRVAGGTVGEPRRLARRRIVRYDGFRADPRGSRNVPVDRAARTGKGPVRKSCTNLAEELNMSPEVFRRSSILDIRTLSLLPALLLGFLTTAPARALAPDGCARVDPPVVLPTGSVCPGLAREGEPLVARSMEGLRGILGVGAGFFGEHGFVAAAFENLTSESGSITVSVFNQGSFTNAAVLYENPESGSGDDVPQWPGTGAARLRRGPEDTTVQARELCFFISVVAMAPVAEA